LNKQFALRSGKFAGKTIEWLEQNERGYLSWVNENRPEMLKGAKDEPKKEVKVVTVKVTKTKMEPNLNFWNEGPHDLSIGYLNKIKEQNDNEG
jgi:hypothetical protein